MMFELEKADNPVDGSVKIQFDVEHFSYRQMTEFTLLWDYARMYIASL